MGHYFDIVSETDELKSHPERFEQMRNHYTYRTEFFSIFVADLQHPTMYKQIIRPLLFQLSPETIHHLVVLGLRILHYIPGGRLLLRACFFDAPSIART